MPKPHPADLSLFARYQQQIAEMEGTISRLRQRVMELNASTSELIYARAHLGDLFQNAPVGYVVHDAAGAIAEINHTGMHLLGFKRAGPGAVSLSQFVAKDEVSLWLDHMHRASRSFPASTDLTLRGLHGKSIPVQLLTCALPPIRRQSPESFRTILIDTTQRRVAEAALARTQQEYQRLIDTIEGIVWEADAHSFELTFISSFAERLLGYRFSNSSGPAFWPNRIYVDDRERVLNAVARAVAKREPLRVDYRVLTADRRIVWLHDNITTLERDGQLRLLGVAVDVSDRHQIEETLRRNQAELEERVTERTAELRAMVQELESFSYSISHDLRAPLRGMLGFAELARQMGGDQLSPEVKDLLQRIIDCGLRADKLVQDVLAYSRVSRANFQLTRVDLDKFVRDLIAQHPDFQPPQAQVRVQSPLLPVLAHEALLGQCITNLLGNAVKFVPPGVVPHIKLWTEKAEDPQNVRLWIEDNGIGIEPENLGRIFNIFERVHSGRQYPGTGIGLAIVRKSVERLGGAVGLESEPGKGSRFWMQLKAA